MGETMTTERYELHRRWHAKMNSPMPDEIAELPIPKIRFAVEQVEKGVVVGILKPRVIDVDESSLEDWDCQDAGRLNTDIGR
jgi:hypothetical protein